MTETLVLNQNVPLAPFSYSGTYPDGTTWTLRSENDTAIFDTCGETASTELSDLFGIWSIACEDGHVRELFVTTPDRKAWDAFEYTDDGKLALIRPHLLSKEDWDRMGGAFSLLGYAMRDGEDTRQCFTELASHKPSGYILNPDQQDAVECLFNGKPKPSETSEWLATADRIEREAIRLYGTTRVCAHVGYITRSGEMLNFSHEGYQRDMDHRDIGELFENEPDLPDLDPGRTTTSMLRFMCLGNIRVGTNFADMMLPPTPAQERGLARMIRTVHGEFAIEISTPTGGSVGWLRYPVGTFPDQILSDIRTVFETGYLPERT